MPPHGVSDKQEVYAEVELLDFQPAKAVTHEGGLATKRVLREGTGLETPHAPYEARSAALLPLSFVAC